MIENKRIAILSVSSRGGGSETFLRGILPSITKYNSESEFHLFVAESRVEHYKGIAKNLIIHSVADQILDNPLRRMIYDNIKISREIKAIKPDLCFCTSEVFSPLLKLLKIPLINVYHAALQFYMKPGVDESRFRLYYTRFMRGISIRLATKTIAVSHFERAEIGGRYPKYMMDKILVIYHGLDHAYFRKPILEEKKVSPLNFPYILCVADRYRHKKIDEMIQIYSIMHAKYDVKDHLVIIGRSKSDKIENQLHELIKKNSLESYVHFIDYVDNKEIREYYWNARLYWTNSSCESFGLTPLEAMACGIPVLSVWSSALPEVYGDAALFYNPYSCNQEEIANISTEILVDTKLREKYIKKGLEHVNKFTWEISGDQYNRVFYKVLSTQ